MKYCEYCKRNYSNGYFRKHERSHNHLNREFEIKYT